MINCIYIHIPFCEKKCNYCAFCSFELIKKKNEYINALIKEINYFYKKEPVKTLYFGGGTPSLLDIDDFEKILSCFNLTNIKEMTIEVNPHNLTYEKLMGLKRLNFNRISLGVQSFDDVLLKNIGRNHTKKEIYTAIDNIKLAGFDNLSIDLIYGLPNQTEKQWVRTIEEAIDLETQHISLYGLKIEKGTYFYKNPPKNLPSQDIQANMYEIAIDKLNSSYIHYEFSNFAKNENYISQHNSAYWQKKNYWGFGLSASGYVENKRYTNTENFSKYIKNPIDKSYQQLTINDDIEEEIFLGLRMFDGIDFEKINNKYDIDIYLKYQKEFEKFLGLDLMEKTKKGIKLTQKGILVSNEILSEFIDA